MSGAEDLARKGADKLADTVEDRGEEWLGKVADEADDLMAAKLPASLALEGRKLTEVLRDHAPALAGAGATGVRLVSAYLLAEDVDQARLTYLREVATAQERDEARMNAGSAMGVVAAERARAWDAFQRALAALGKVAAKVGLAFVMAALPV